MLHMYSILVARSCTQASLLPHTGQLSTLTEVPGKFFLPSCDDISKLKSNLVILVSRVITDPALFILQGCHQTHPPSLL